MRHFHILVPAPAPAGPVKGAYALANALVRSRSVTLVALKRGPGADAVLHPDVEFLSLADVSWRAKISSYRRLLRKAGGRSAAASISMCLSADFVNLFCSDIAATCSSVRGNLLYNYRLDYGGAGVPIAVAHLASLRAVDHVTVMTESMQRQVRRYLGSLPAVIANFVDETVLDEYRAAAPPQGPLRFVFLGSLTERKQPALAVRAVAEIRRRSIDAHLDVVGDGPLRLDLAREIERLALASEVTLHGFSRCPYPVVAAADALVLPSLSEGMSRACLESLHLGVPCVMRAADGNSEVIGASNGRLFEHDGQLVEAMLQAAALSRARAGRSSLLPEPFRQLHAADAYRELLESGP